MEEGSLVQEALQRMQEQDGALLQNTLMVDVFLLEKHDRIKSFQELARLTHGLNSFIQKRNWPWHTGGQGLVFGVHATEGQAHLRATCHYGECIQDEWFSIAVMLHLSSIYDIAVECWDLDDGQVLLVESANVLPQWINELEPQACRHRCWIQKGKVVLINNEKEELERLEALQILKSNNESIQAPKEVQQAIHNRIHDFMSFLEQPKNVVSQLVGNYLHRAPFVVPRRVAALMQQRPELVQCAILAYCQSVDNNKELGKEIPFSDLGWTSHTLQKTSHAMLRTISQDTTIPMEYRSIEANRMKRTCQVESTPHLRHALQNGIRVTIGFEQLLKKHDEKRQEHYEQDHALQHWSRIDIECGGNGEWLAEAWQAGPNNAAHDLTDLIKCPVYNPQIVNGVCPESHPGVSLRDQIKAQLGNNKRTSDIGNFDVPLRPQDVDSDAWLELDSVQEMDELIMETTTKTTSNNDKEAPLRPQSSGPVTKQQETSNTEVETLNTMLGSFQTFVGERSDVAGVSHDKKVHNDGIEMADALEPVDINPRVFMNLLHTVLKSSPEELSFSNINSTGHDPFFSKEDYDLLDEEESSDEDDMDGDEAEDVESMKAVMRAMDDELRGTEASLVLDGVQDEQDGTDNTDEEVALNTHVLSNLLGSLDASGGGPGPVHNILTEMGVDLPKLQKEQTETESST